MGQYERHVFVCTTGGTCPTQGDTEAFVKEMRTALSKAGLHTAIRVNKAGCMDRCAGGPVAVVYPEAVWYTYVDQHDIDEIVDSHLKNGRVVERLLLPPTVGR